MTDDGYRLTGLRLQVKIVQNRLARHIAKVDMLRFHISLNIRQLFGSVNVGHFLRLIQQLENNLIYPRVVGTSIGLPGMWVLVAVTIGGDLMGVGGMLLMIPLTSVLYTLLREFTDKRLEQRGIPEEKLQDHPPEIKSQFQKNKERKERRRLQKMKEKFLEMQSQKKK